MYEEAFSSEYGFHYFIFVKDGWEETVIIEEDVVAMHEIVVVGGEDWDSIVVEDDPPPIFFEWFDASHIHGIFVMAVVHIGSCLLRDVRLD